MSDTKSILDDFFGQKKPKFTKPRIDEFYEYYGLEQNPFPPNRMVVSDVIYGQDDSIEKFRNCARDILISSIPIRRALGVVAGTGGGKTHFLRYCQNQFASVCKAIDKTFAITEFVAGSGNITELVCEIYRSADTVCRERYERDFALSIILEILEADRLDLVNEIQINDLRESILTVYNLLNEDSSDTEDAEDLEIDPMLTTFRKWLHAGTLTQAEKRRLSVGSRISTPSLAVKIQRELFDLARNLGILDGVFLCIDEMESLFSKGMSHGRIQSFLQDLRYLYDESVKENKGYRLFLLSASTTTGAATLLKNNYPVYQRLGYEGENKLVLRRVESVIEAMEFSSVYINHFHEEWRLKHKQAATKRKKKNPSELLTPREIEEAFKEAELDSGEAPQGPLLDRLYRKVQEKRSLFLNL